MTLIQSGTGTVITKFKEVATHTLNPNQLSAGDDRRIHHGINKAMEVIDRVLGEGMTHAEKNIEK